MDRRPWRKPDNIDQRLSFWYRKTLIAHQDVIEHFHMLFY
jgi:hypothetical protein